MKSYKQFCPPGVGDRLTRAMRDKKMDCIRLGKAVGLDRKTILGYKHDDTPMTITTCFKICAILGITPNYLITGKE